MPSVDNARKRRPRFFCIQAEVFIVVFLGHFIIYRIHSESLEKEVFFFYNEDGGKTMFTCFVPTYHAKSIYEVDPSFYKAIGVKNLLIDLDNTLDSYRLFTPSERAFTLVKKLQEAGLHVYILSNNHGPRVSSYATKIQLPFLHSARKPFAFKVKSSSFGK